jgi:hypothetical protein
VEQHAADDLDAAGQAHGVGGPPAGREQGLDHLRPVADQADVERVAGNGIGGVGDLGRGGEGRVAAGLVSSRHSQGSTT